MTGAGRPAACGATLRRRHPAAPHGANRVWSAILRRGL